MLNDKTQPVYEYFLSQGFKPITAENLSLFKQYENDTRLIQLSATLTINWASASNGSYKIIMGYLCSIWFFNDGTYFCIQTDKNTTTPLKCLIDELYDLCIASGLPDLKVNFIDEPLLGAWTNIEGYKVASEYEQGLNEYVYDPNDILCLSGKENQNKRTIINKFSKMTDLNIVSLTKDTFSSCFEIERAWCATQDCPYCRSSFGCARDSLETMQSIFNTTMYQGAFALLNNKPVAYAIWEKNKNTTFLYFAKSSLDNFNIYWYYLLVNNYLFDVKNINVGCDMGIPGLRHFKTHLSKHTLLRNYLCVFCRE
ncbi:hypothetical protein FACS1894102_2710 [Spirochaetia bacterium]|nr:hypothetical protein FACS1894102_2710 [Spirochaetia bacterium]